MKLLNTTLLSVILLFTIIQSAQAHFGMIIPAEPVVTPEKRTIQLKISFSHPFEETGMDLMKPEQFYVVKDREKTDLTTNLHEARIMDHLGWQAAFPVKRPGVYHFVMEPFPYWEPTEDIFIVHYTKVIIPAFGSEDGWDQPLGLATEIVPLLRPFGNYAGNTFTGQVLLADKPVPGAGVEVELYNQNQQVKAASPYHITQVIKADSTGVFSFTCPVSGWWGFSALNIADYTLKNPEGEEKKVELGAVLWTYMDSYVSQPASP
ncbi:MAG TPA: DUF4198 domain-containing protein [Desulfobacterales bacterium]|nr:DUF4198 domain-containing protein [Desulfobacterales bacterium]HIP38950.1 DUF4198 domain-containing protein [Desulfocapsa sulfexigens]